MRRLAYLLTAVLVLMGGPGSAAAVADPAPGDLLPTPSHSHRARVAANEDIEFEVLLADRDASPDRLVIRDGVAEARSDAFRLDGAVVLASFVERAIYGIADVHPRFARPPPGEAVACVYDGTADSVDPAGDRGRVRRAFSDSGEGFVAPSATARLSTPSSRALGANLEAAGMTRSRSSAAHHIVAGGSQRAAEARAVLARYGIDINAAENGVFLPLNRAAANPTGAAVHSTLHTNAYYSTFNDLLLSAGTRAEALDALAYLRQSLLGGGL